MYLKITLDLIEYFLEHNRRPILKEDRNEIIARHSASPGSTIMNQLENMYGVLEIEDGGSEIDKTCRMILNLILVESERGVADNDLIVHYPLDHKGKTLGSLKEELGINGDTQVTGDVDGPEFVPAMTPHSSPAKSKPIELRGIKAHAYKLLKSHARDTNNEPISPRELEAILEPTGSRSVRSLVSTLEQLGLLFTVSGERKSRTNPSMRAVVFHPTLDDEDNLTVPPECLPPEAGLEEESCEQTMVIVMLADTTPVVLRGLKIPGYKALLALQREQGDQPLNSQQIKEVLAPTGVASPFSLLHSLTAMGLCKVVSGKVGSKHDPPMRMVCFHPFQEGNDGQVVIPPECKESEPEPVTTDLEPEPEAEEKPTGIMPDKGALEVRLRAAQEAADDLMDNFRAPHLSPIQDQIAELSQEEARLNARLEKIQVEAEQLACSLQELSAKLDADGEEPEGYQEALQEIKRYQRAITLYEELQGLLD